VAESKLADWNEFAAAERRPWYKLTTENIRDENDDVVEAIPEGTEGDKVAGQMANLRSRLVPPERWSPTVLAFAALWNRWKNDRGLIDFTDMLEIALSHADTAPGDPAALLVDEAQDLSRLSWALARKWGERAVTFVTVGDPDQLLYHWAGVERDAFCGRVLPADQTRVLKQSFRVPRAVHRAAIDWIGRTPGREPVEYHPRDEDGLVRTTDATAAYPDDLIEEAQRHAAAGRTVLFATTCAYQLRTIIGALRHAGVPFHNPYRTKRGDWNPLQCGRGTSAAQRVLSFVSPEGRNDSDASWWTVRDLAAFTEWLESKRTLVRGAKKRIEEWMDQEPARIVTGNELFEVLGDDGVDKLLDRDLAWLVNNTLERHKRQLYYPARVVNLHGVEALRQTPRVVVSTIHGCKGGQADVVYLFPDLSPRAAAEWDERDGAEGKEGIRRAIYVGMTRARQELVLCSPSSPMCVAFN
jgi:superfamily I DNA/RNA helicase